VLLVLGGDVGSGLKDRFYGTTFRETGFYSKIFSESRFRLSLTKNKKDLRQAPTLLYT